MRISETLTYDAPTDVVFDMLRDPEFQELKCAEAGAVEHHATVAPEGDGVRIVTTRDLPTTHLPDFAKSVVGSTLRTTETWLWGPRASDGSRDGNLVVAVDGAPVTLRATVRLASASPTSTLQVDGDLKAAVPLLGGKIEKAAAPAVVDAIRGEEHTARRWLAGGR